jgi:hypothetical protein
LFSAFLLLSLSRVSAQVTATAPPLSTTLEDYNNRWDAFGGFAYAPFNTTIGHALRGNLMGFKAQATGWLTPIVGISVGTGNYYGHVSIPANVYNITNPSISEHTFLVGPEFRVLRAAKWTVDYHFLLGGVYGVFDKDFKAANIEPNVLGLYNNQLAFALATGGSFDYNINSKFSARAIADFQPTHYGLAFQKEFAGSLGVVYKWGAIKK